METEVEILNALIGFLVKNGVKMENIELSLLKNELTFKKNKKEYSLKLTKKILKKGEIKNGKIELYDKI